MNKKNFTIILLSTISTCYLKPMKEELPIKLSIDPSSKQFEFFCDKIRRIHSYPAEKCETVELMMELLKDTGKALNPKDISIVNKEEELIRLKKFAKALNIITTYPSQQEYLLQRTLRYLLGAGN